MTLELSAGEDGVRTKLEEEDWAAAVASVDADLTAGPAPLAGTTPRAGAETGPGLAAAIRLTALAPLRLVVLSGLGPAGGLLGTVTTDGQAVASVVRRLVPRPQDASGQPQVGEVPGVEVGAGEAAQTAAEVVRLLPPPQGEWGPGESEVAMPKAEASALIASGATEPAVVTSLRHVHGDATILLEEPGQPRRLWRLLAGERGWVALSARGDLVRHRPLTPQALHDEVQSAVIDAVARLVTAAR